MKLKNSFKKLGGFFKSKKKEVVIDEVGFNIGLPIFSYI